MTARSIADTTQTSTEGGQAQLGPDLKHDFLSLAPVGVLLAHSPISQAHIGSASGGLDLNDRLLRFEENTPSIMYGQGVLYLGTRLLRMRVAGALALQSR
jgi:hypothetical protein